MKIIMFEHFEYLRNIYLLPNFDQVYCGCIEIEEDEKIDRGDNFRILVTSTLVLNIK